MPFAPTTCALSAGPVDRSTTESTSLRADFESWFRRAARGIVERVLGAYVSAESTTRCGFPRKPVKISRVAQPVVDALDRASNKAAYEEDTRAHSSVEPRESRLRTWWVSAWDSLLTTLQISNVKEPSDQFSGELVRQPDKAYRSHWTSWNLCLKPWAPNGPVGPKDTSLIAIWWLLREIETAAVICENVSTDTVRRRVTLF